MRAVSTVRVAHRTSSAKIIIPLTM